MSRFYCIIPGLIGQEVGSFVVCVGAIPAQAQEAGIGGDDGVRCKTARFRLSLILYARILKQVDLVKTQFTSLVYVLRLVWMCPQILFCGLHEDPNSDFTTNCKLLLFMQIFVSFSANLRP